MPKEIIRGNPRGDSDDDRTTHVEVGWNRNMEVQIGLHLPFKSLAFVEIDPKLGYHAPITELFDSLWTDLSREQINRLIRALRKARDAAYGSDA